MITIKKGLDVPIAGAPMQRLGDTIDVKHYAVLGCDYAGLKPTMLVAESDAVQKGQALFEDKKNPGVIVSAPVSGKVVSINRGERRAFQSLVIARDDSVGAVSFTKHSNLSVLTKEDVAQSLQASGEWTALRTRPFNKVAAVDSTPDAIFITVADSNPLAIDPSLVVNSNIDAFYDGLMIIGKLTQGKVYICTSPKTQIDLGRLDIGNKSNFSHQVFSGVHPAGNASTHIHHLYPVSDDRMVWTINYQDVIAYGKFFREGVIYSHRDISLAGPQVSHPRLVKIERGASMTEVADGQLKEGDTRLISGSILSGHHQTNESEAFLGRYHCQISALEEGGERPMLHYVVAGRKRYSAKPIYLSVFNPKRLWNFTATSNGSARAMVPISAYEEVMPLDILPTQLLRAIVVGDSEKAQSLGCLELVEEDLALCSYICPSKYEYGPILRNVLTSIEEEG